MKPSAEALFERYHDRVYRYFRRVTGRHEAAQDLTQELFLRLVGALGSYAAIGHETEWVFRAARNLAFDHQRKIKDKVEGEWREAAAVGVESTQLAALGLAEALSLLSETDRETLLLHEVSGLSYQELAVSCQTTPAAVSQRLYRVRARLRQLLGSRIGAADRKRGALDG